MGADDNMLSLLESLMPEPAEDVARKIADDFRQRRVEKGLTRTDIARKSGVSIANITRFEQKALISLNNLIELAIALGYNLEIKNIFATPKYSTMEELLQIHKNKGKTKAYKRRKQKS
ncbi:MAG: helix-turn-helix transcriptional regulator [Muribaculaceae bacterium]|nr:helix-turn-helix transcriptional regulator [Muribaculaceae bacterium]